ncbi:Asp-tRNA(Asn)/Glu-tRNA(Gln) amidotransferase subunit GatB [Candidatus Parcubacteria bacterium]|nr:Asp-tRNA(Asn)/Glu-tRNA(Gln) amidotransferase subunit GatB [Candidatus Parcubacteria bacterium]
MEYFPTIGLEIHAELKTATKMFCKCLNDSDEKHPNINVCPICMGHPGTLPVINKEAVKKVLITGKALKGELADYSQFDRKNYFYPDLPKGYQISQYKYPLVNGGELNGIKITRVHLEEDTGSLGHINEKSLVSFNRAGVPLMELVTEPVIKSAQEARKFAEELQLILRYLDVSDADMEKGQMRVEANISLSSEGAGKSVPLRTGIAGNSTGTELPSPFQLGTKVEIKNLNSFRAVERAINYEIERQSKMLDNGESVKHETRGWNENKERTFAQREKEKSHDYRYFPEPDLPSLNLKKLGFQTETKFPNIELPQQKRERFKKEYDFKDEQIEIFIRDKKFADYFEEIATEIANLDTKCPLGHLVSLAANYLISDLQSLLKEKMLSVDELLVTPGNFAELVKMIGNGEITSRVGKDVLRIMVETGKKPLSVVKEKGLGQTDDEDIIQKIVDEIIQENPLVAESFKKGREQSLQFLIGEGMKKTKGSVNPKILSRFLKESLK